MLRMSKRQRFITTSILLSLGFFLMQFLPDRYRFISIALLGIFTLVTFTWSLKEGLKSDMTLLTLVLPVLYTLGVGLFWFLLPTNIFTRIPIVILYGFGVYALCLTANIYTVAAIRTIALLRSARGVGFVLTLLTFFLLFDTILSLRQPVYVTSLLVASVSIPLYWQGFWSVDLKRGFSFNILKRALIAGLIMMEIALSLFFWPVTVVVGSLFLTVSCYVLLGLGQSDIEGRLFLQTIREYLTIGVVVFIAMFLATRWGV
jgi:hypothetical protein